MVPGPPGIVRVHMPEAHYWPLALVAEVMVDVDSSVLDFVDSPVASGMSHATGEPAVRQDPAGRFRSPRGDGRVKQEPG